MSTNFITQRNTFKRRARITLRFYSRPILWFLQDCWSVIEPLWFILFMLILSGIILNGNDQSKDLFVSLIESYQSNNFFYNLSKLELYHLLLNGIVIIYSLAIWYSARIILQLAHINAPSSNRVITLIDWTPRILGLIPYLQMIIGLSSEVANQQSLFTKPNPILLLYIISASLYSLFVVYRTKYILPLLGIQPISTRHQTLPTRWRNLPRASKITLRIAAMAALFFSVLFWLPVEWGISQKFGPATIVILGLSIYTLAGMWFIYLGHKSRLPALGILLFLFFVFSFLNNNHSIRTFPDKEYPYNSKLPDSTYFDNWVLHRSAEIDSLPEDSLYRVYIVAAEGGGIRAAYWTASVLAKLQETDSTFYKHVFAISGVSGGSVGAAVYNALYRDYILNGQSLGEDTTLLQKTSEILGQDFLSPLTGAMLFPDFIQRILPFPIEPLDRARWLEDSWQAAYKKRSGDLKLATLDSSFLSLWKGNPYELPCLFFNSTRVETGQKAITTNVALSSEYFRDIVDLHEVVRKHIPLKTVASMSARFPLVTPPATIQTANKANEDSLWGHVVDGGYFENTGLSTGMEILHMINTLTDTSRKDSPLKGRAYKIRPEIIYITNGDTSITDKKAIKFSYELRTPMQAFYNAWGRGSVATSYDVKNVVKKLRYKSDFYCFDLRRDTDTTLPLGWFLSATAQSYLRSELNSTKFKKDIGKFLRTRNPIIENKPIAANE